MNLISRNTTLLSALILGFANPLFAQVPDLTKDTQAVDRKATYNLGATGLRGWIYTKAANNLDAAQGRTTLASRQILVTHVGAASPADGVVKVDDVILGVDGKPFSDDARKSIAIAIQEAETEAKGGVLKLLVSRGGQPQELTLKLAVLGTYSATAPWDCTKSKRIFEKACEVLEKEKLTGGWTGSIQGLALLATGNPEHLPKLKELARSLAEVRAEPDKKPDGPIWGDAWDLGYRNLFLCEYFLITRDREVLPAIDRIALLLARGQSMYGTFGHGFAALTKDGKFNGSVPPYGPVNMAGLPANLSIVMAKKCGVKHPEVDQAIVRAAGFFGYFTDKGAIPYGEHEPWPYHENNGKNSITAVMFSAMGDKPIETGFFSRMATAGYANREYGHTGQGFSYLWSALGAACGGPEAAAAFFRKASWHFDLVRRSDGSFTYDGGEQYGAGKTDDDTYFGKSGYSGLSPAATYVLTYALPLRKLVITGRDADRSGWLDRKQAAATVASGRFDLDRREMSPQQLVEAFDNWSPIVRSWAAEELSKRPESKTMVAALIALAGGTDPHRIQGACETLGLLNTPDALPVLVKQLSHQDRWVRYKAAQAIRKMGGTAKPAVEGILKALVSTAEPSWPIRWEDPVQIAHGQLAAAVFSGPLKEELNKLDPKLRYAAIRSVSTNPDGMARATLDDFFQNRLSQDDVVALAPVILAAVESPSPADTMFNNVIRMAGLKALTKYHFKEGIAAAVGLAKTQGGHGSETRTGQIMKLIEGYGAAAKSQIPAMREIIVMFDRETAARRFPPSLNKNRVGAVEDAIRLIESATTQPDLRSIKDVKRPVKVFILAGQSNMEGQGVVSMDGEKDYNGGKGNLVWSMANSKSAAKMKCLKNDRGEWVVRDDVQISFKVGDKVRKGGLTVGYTGYGGSSHIGPELGFGMVMGDHFEEPVLLIKTAWGGKSLFVDFRPPSSGGQVGPFYTKMVEEVRAALDGLGDQKYELAGFVWQQGWNDMCTKEAIPEYAANLVNLAKDLRQEFKAPNMPVVVGELGNGGPVTSGDMFDFRVAQEQGTKRIKNALFIKTTDFARPAELSPNPGHGHHWFGNAESYFMIGNALGEGMKTLLQNRGTP